MLGIVAHDANQLETFKDENFHTIEQCRGSEKKSSSPTCTILFNPSVLFEIVNVKRRSSADLKFYRCKPAQLREIRC